MDRKSFLAAGCCALALFDDAPAAQAQAEADREREFVKNWLTDLFASMDAELDDETKVRVMAGCGRGCFRRFQFKQDIARLGRYGPRSVRSGVQGLLLFGCPLSPRQAKRRALRVYTRDASNNV